MDGVSGGVCTFWGGNNGGEGALLMVPMTVPDVIRMSSEDSFCKGHVIFLCSPFIRLEQEEIPNSFKVVSLGSKTNSPSGMGMAMLMRF